MCCRYTTTPKCWSGVCVSTGFRSYPCSLGSVVALRVELSTTRLSAVSGQPALDYHCANVVVQSGWQDSNLPRAPKARRTAPYSRLERAESSSSRPDDTRLRYVLLSSRAGVNPPCRRPTDRRTACGAPSTQLSTDFTQWVGRCSNPRLRLFRPPLHHLSYRPQQKKPDVLVTPGFRYSSRISTAECHVRNG